MDDDQKLRAGIVDPVLKEQLEIQLRSQYKWQANNLWIYWLFLVLGVAFTIFGLFGVINTMMNDPDVVSLIIGVVFTGIGMMVTGLIWGAYNTAKEMADKLKQAEAESS